MSLYNTQLNSTTNKKTTPIKRWFFINFGARGGSRTRMKFPSKDFKSFVYTIPPLGQKLFMRHGWESHPRIRVLQTLALLLGYRALFANVILLIYSVFSTSGNCSSDALALNKSSSIFAAFAISVSLTNLILGIGLILKVLFILY